MKLTISIKWNIKDRPGDFKGKFSETHDLNVKGYPQEDLLLNLWNDAFVIISDGYIRLASQDKENALANAAFMQKQLEKFRERLTHASFEPKEKTQETA